MTRELLEQLLRTRYRSMITGAGSEWEELLRAFTNLPARDASMDAVDQAIKAYLDANPEARPRRGWEERPGAMRRPACSHGQVFRSLAECSRPVVGSYRIQHRTRTRFAAELWQPAQHGVVELIIVPAIAVFEAVGCITLYRTPPNQRSSIAAELDDVAAREDGSMSLCLHAEVLQAGKYELALLQRSGAGAERQDRFRISITDPHRPLDAPAMALRAAGARR